jgi:hypothetical protein
MFFIRDTLLLPFCNLNSDIFETTGDYGYIFEVDLEYPSHLHDKHSGLPMAPEHNKEFQKLIPHFNDRINYKVHIITLRMYLKHGLILKKIHRVLKFAQSAWLKPYIEANTLIRKQSNIQSEKDNAKLMNNAVYGKTMENKIGRQSSVIKSGKQISEIFKLITDHTTFKSFNIINEDMVQIDRHADSVIFDSPIYVGFCILDLSKACNIFK